MSARSRPSARVRLLLACALALLAPPALFADAPRRPQKLATVEGITEYRLDNGLRVLLYPDDSSPTVTVNLVVLVGSRMEGYGETGMAHLLEHMQFKGTPQHSDIPKALKAHGAQFNATTWVDRTNFFETLPATQDNLDFALQLEADRLVNSYIRGKDLASEMTVVRSEFEMGENSPERILSQRVLAVAYEWHNYGKSTIGNRADIERVPIANLQAFYHKYYRPDNAVLIVGGQFNPEKALASIARDFGPLKKPDTKLVDTYTQEPPQDGERSVHLRRVGEVGQIDVVYHIPAASEEDYPAIEVLSEVLVSQPAGRLYQALVEAKKATSVSGEAYGWHDPGVLEISVQADPKGLEEARDVTINLLEGLSRQKMQEITPEEVDRARRRLLKERELLMTKSNRVVMQLGEWEARGDWRLFFIHRDRLEKVTAADVNRVAARYLLRSNRSLGLFIPTQDPQRAVIPDTPIIADLVQDYKGREAVAAGENFDPTPANIEKRVKRAELPGGVKTALLPKKTRGEAVTAELRLHYGNEKALRGHTSATQFLASLMERGTKKHNRQQIQDELDRLGVRLGASGGLGDLTFTIQAKRKTLPEALRLLGEILREPTFPVAEFEILKGEARDALRQGLTEPQALASRELQRRLSPYPPEDVRYVPTIEESLSRLEAVKVGEVEKLYREQVGAQAGELAVVGDFDPEEVSRLAGEVLAGWKAAVPYRRIDRPAQTDVEGGRQEIHTPDKANAVYVAGEMLALTDTDPDYPALKAGNFILGGGTLSSRLGNRVRQKEGLSYGVGSMFSADAQDKSARFAIFAICNPVNIGKVDAAVREEVSRLLKEGVQEDELAEAKKSILEQQKVQRANDAHLVGVLAEELFNGRTFAYYADLEKKLQALTPEEVGRALRKHLDPARLVTIEAGDFHKKK